MNTYDDHGASSIDAHRERIEVRLIELRRRLKIVHAMVDAKDEAERLRGNIGGLEWVLREVLK